MAVEHIVQCWYCTMEYDLLTAEWCKCNPEHPTKVCPYCLKCFCQAPAEYKQRIWAQAPESIQKERASLQSPKDRLGDLLIKQGLLSTKQLVKALKQQREQGGKLGEILIALGYVAPDKLLSVLAWQYDLVQISLKNQKIPSPSLFRLLPISFCEQHLVVPLEEQTVGEKQILYIVTVSPPNKKTIAHIRERTRYQVYPYLAQEKDIRKFLTRVKAELGHRLRTGTYSQAANRLAGKICHALSKRKSLRICLHRQEDNSVHVQLYTLFGKFELAKLTADIAGEVLAYFMGQSGHPDIPQGPFWRSLRLSCRDGALLPVVLHWQPGQDDALLEIIPIREERFHLPIDGWNMPESDRQRLISGISKDKGISMVLCSKRMEVLPFIYSCLNFLIQRNKHVLSLEQILPVMDAGWRQQDLAYIEHITDFDPSLSMFADYNATFIEANPLHFFDTSEQILAIAEKSHLLLLFSETDPSACLKQMEGKDLLDQEVLSFVTQIVRLTPVPALCPSCRSPMPMKPRMLKALGLSDEEASGLETYKAAGCTHCHQTGFYGTVPLFHVHDFSRISRQDIPLMLRNLDQVAAYLPPGHVRSFGLELVHQGRIRLSDLLKQVGQ